MKMQIMKSIMNKISKSRQAADGEWIEIKNSLDELPGWEFRKDSL